MSFAEFLVLIIIVCVLFWLLRPLQKWLEVRIVALFKKKGPHRGPIIDVTDSIKKKDKNNG